MITLSTLKDFTLSIGSAAKDASVAESAGFFGAIGAFFASSTVLIITFAIIAIAMMVLLEFEREGWATMLFSLAIGLLIWTFKMSLLALVTTNPLATIGFIIFYVVAGVAWSAKKWNSFTGPIFDKYQTLKEEFIKQYKEINDKTREAFVSRIKDAGIASRYLSKDSTEEEILDAIEPSTKGKKSVIIAWISYWPLSLLASLLNNPFRKFFTFIYNRVSGIYDYITKYHRRRITET